MAFMDRGLDLSNLDSITQTELDEFNKHYATWDGRAHPGLNLFFDLGQPGFIKRYRLFAHFLATAPTTAINEGNVTKILASANNLTGISAAIVFYYGLLGYEPGVLYPIHGLQRTGFSKAQVTECLAISCMYSGPRGMETIANALKSYTWLEPDFAPNFVNGWARDESKLFAGLDYSTPDLLPGELRKLEEWFGETIGEVPTYLRFMARYNPGLLKAYRNRWEHLLTTLPNQVLPMALLQIHILRSDRRGIRENALLAKAWGVTLDEMVHAICGWLLFVEMEGAALIHETIGDLIDNWEK